LEKNARQNDVIIVSTMHLFLSGSDKT
jgi:hypothetical protein